jgi:hypothetical protein
MNRAFRKWTIVALGPVLALVLLPIALSAFSSRSPHIYYEGGRCACGHDTFIRVTKDGYFQYSPGHGVPEHRSFTIRPHDGEWEVLGLPHSDMYWSPLEGEDKVIARLRIHDGALYESWGGSTNWTRRARVINPYRVWFAKLTEKQ